MYIYVCVCVCVCVDIYIIYICMYICIYIYIYIYIYVCNVLITQSTLASERNSVVVGSDPTQTKFLQLLLKILQG